MRFDCDIDAFKDSVAMDEVEGALTVDRAVKALDAGDLDSHDVHEVLQRRAGSIYDYRKVKEYYERVLHARRQCGTAS